MSSAHRWLLAARPATLWAGIAPVVVGSALAIADDEFRADALIGALLVALTVQIGVNFANDLSDARRGADTDKRIGPTRAVASGLISPSAMARGVATSFGIAVLGGVYLAAIAGPIVLVIGAASFIAALGYTGGPFPYGYHGFGEVFVFVFFGLVATVGTRYVFDETAPTSAWVGGVVMGLLASAILIANNVRDIETDRSSGKHTLAVILGRSAARRLFAATISGAFVAVVIGVATAALPSGALLMLIAAPLALGPISVVLTHVEGPALITALKATARLQILSAVLLGIGVTL